jgi:site-specific recombinase XerD
MSNIFKSHFFLRKEKTDPATNKCPLYLRITKEKRTEISLNKSVDPSKWNSEKQRVSGSSPEARVVNDFLKSVEVKLHNAYNTLLNKGEVITADSLKAVFLDRTDDHKTVLQLFDYQIEQIKRGLGKTYSTSTLKKYEYCRNHLKNCLWKNFNATDLFLAKIDYYFITQFQHYLTDACEFKNEVGEIVVKAANDHNSTLKYLKMFKTVIGVGIAFNWLSNDPFARFKEKFVDVEQVYLTAGELKQLLSKDIQIERLSIIRDLFAFTCFTGLAYADLNKLSQGHLITGIDGRKWIHITRTKSETPCRIPVMPIALEILEKYADHPICQMTSKLLPVSSNQKLNAYLKEIADLCGIKKNLTCHVGRRTFASIALNAGVPAETIVKIIGHKNFKHLHLYAKSNDEKIASDLDVLANQFGNRLFNNLKADLLAVAK